MCTSDVSTPGCKLSMIVLRNGKQVVIILNFIPISVIMIVLKLSYVWSDDKDVDAMYRSRNMVSGVVSNFVEKTPMVSIFFFRGICKCHTIYMGVKASFTSIVTSKDPLASQKALYHTI